jgi:hypothetical protein
MQAAAPLAALWGILSGKNCAPPESCVMVLMGLMIILFSPGCGSGDSATIYGILSFRVLHALGPERGC